MKIKRNLIGGFAGALALNILHETVRRFESDAPRIELVGEEAVTKVMKRAGAVPPTGDRLYATTLVADVISNGFYYSMIGLGKRKYFWLNGLKYGFGAGIGALLLTKPIGLSDAPVTKTNKIKSMTVAYYVFGGLVAAAVMKAYDK